MWTDYYLKFNDREALMAALPPAWIEDGAPVLATFTMALDVVGTVYRDDTGEELPGYHVNLRLKDEAELPPEMAPALLETPEIRKQVFA